ncbi:conserved protein, unknown function, partial [Plasmodium gaboni]
MYFKAFYDNFKEEYV